MAVARQSLTLGLGNQARVWLLATSSRDIVGLRAGTPLQPNPVMDGQ